MPKSMFQQGFSKSGFTPLRLDLGGRRLAQSTAVTEATRNDMLGRLVAAGDKLALVNAWTQVHQTPVDVQVAFSTDAARWSQLLGNIDAGGWGGASARVQQALASPDPGVWETLTASDWNGAENWIMAATELGAILARHPSAVPAAPKPGVAAPPAATTGINPWLIGGGVAAIALVAVLALS